MSIDPAAETARWLATLSPEDLERAVAYTRGGHWLLLWGAIVAIVVSWLIIRTGLLSGIRDRLERRRRRPKLVSLVVGVVYLLVSFVLTLPWAIYESWWRETQYGLTSQPLAGWLTEALMGTAISTVFAGLLIVGLYSIIRHARRLWWAWGAGLTGLAVVFMLIVSPILIEPLFNDYTPAPDGPMRDSVVELAQGLEAVAKVPESDIGRLRVGQGAVVRLDAFPDRGFAARVRQIAPRAEKLNNVTSFQVKLTLVQRPPQLRIGMTADIDFNTGELAPRTLVPTVAVVTEEGKPGVLLVGKGNQPSFQPVTLGSSSGRDTQILSGLKPGVPVFIDLPPWAKKGREKG
jgi:hypothetical protein